MARKSNDDDNRIARAILVSLQMVAMALVVLIGMNMSIESANHAPANMCIVAPPGRGPATPAPPGTLTP